MKPSKWKIFSKPEAGKEYTAMLTYLPLKKYSGIPSAISDTKLIEKQLVSAAGLIGYSVQAEFFKKIFRTLSVWEDEKALYDFVKKSPHIDIMKTLKPKMNKPEFIKWKVKGSGFPPDWNTANNKIV